LWKQRKHAPVKPAAEAHAAPATPSKPARPLYPPGTREAKSRGRSAAKH